MGARREVWVKIRASEAERAEWHAKARSVGLSLSDLVGRSVGRGRAKPHPRTGSGPGTRRRTRKKVNAWAAVQPRKANAAKAEKYARCAPPRSRRPIAPVWAGILEVGCSSNGTP